MIEYVVCLFLQCGRVRFNEPDAPPPVSVLRPNHCSHAWKPNLPECRK